MDKKIKSVALASLVAISAYVPGYAKELKDIRNVKFINIQEKELSDIFKIYFSDTKGHWAESEINQFADLGYIVGYSDGTFKPNNSVTRAEFVKIMNNAFGLTNFSGRFFSDTQNHWARKDIDIAVTNGVCNGKSDTEFKPDDFITREEAALMIANYNKIKDTNYDKINTISDKEDISLWAKDGVEGVIEKGYMVGYGDNTFRPKGKLTRSEAVTTLNRVKISDEKLEIDNVQAIINKIDLLEDNITRENVSKERSKVDEIAVLIYSISNAEKQQITNINKLKSARKNIETMERDIKESKKVEKSIDELLNVVNVDNIDLPHKKKVDDVRESYEALSDNAKTIVDSNKLKKIEELENRLKELINEIDFGDIKINHLISLIEVLPDDVNKLTYIYEETINYARFLFNRLTPEEQKLITNISKLTNAEKEWKRLKDEKDKVTASISKIPSLENLTLNDKTLVVEARNIFDSAENRIKEHVFILNFPDLVKAEIKIEKLEKLRNESEANDLAQKLEYLMNTELTLEDKDDILGLRDDYYKLSSDSRELIDFGLIQRLEIRISKLEASSK